MAAKTVRKRATYAKRVASIEAELERLDRPATRAELAQRLPKDLFPNKRSIDRTFREDQEQPQPVLQKLARNQYAVRAGALGSRPEVTTPSERSRIYERGQTVVPKAIRDALAIEQGSTLVWEVEGGLAKVIALPKDPIKAARGILKGKGPTFQEFLADRNAERARERELEADEDRRWRTYSTRRR
jgi:bifunctional DNA-binding transcriptional regulator/antitoxin component of YhaV-PrlF toxin-antitoxin module